MLIRSGLGLSFGIVFSVLLFRRRAWPAWVGLGFGAGRAWEECDSVCRLHSRSTQWTLLWGGTLTLFSAVVQERRSTFERWAPRPPSMSMLSAIFLGHYGFVRARDWKSGLTCGGGCDLLRVAAVRCVLYHVHRRNGRSMILNGNRAFHIVRKMLQAYFDALICAYLRSIDRS